MAQTSESAKRTAASAARWAGTAAARVLRAWRALPYERRLAAGAAFGLFVTLFLPWYQETVIAPGKTKLQAVSASLTGWGAFSFVEAAVLLVAVGVLTLLIQRSEGRAFHLPGGDGTVIMLAGFWTCVLVIWRIFDKQGTSSHKQYATTSGIEWGIFVALAVAAFLAYAGSRIRAAHRPEPPLPGERRAAVVARPPAPAREPAEAEPAEPATATPPRPARAGPPETPREPGSASERRTGWLTAPPEGWTEDPDLASRQPTGSWSYADDYVEEAPAAPEDEEAEEPATQAKPAARGSRPEEAATEAKPRGSRPEDPTNVQEPEPADSTPPPGSAPGRRRRRQPQPDDQLTIRLDRENDA